MGKVWCLYMSRSDYFVAGVVVVVVDVDDFDSFLHRVYGHVVDDFDTFFHRVYGHVM